MAHTDPPAIATRGAHPLHVILSAFPIAYFVGAFATDIVYMNTAEMMWANFSIWLITFGLVFGFIAAAAGLVEALSRRDRYRGRPGHLHSLGNGLVLILSLFNAFVHSRDGYTSVVPSGLILSGIVALLVLVTSWHGATLGYVRTVETAR